MIHFTYLVAFAVLVAVAFGVFTSGSLKDKLIAGGKGFAQFVLISLILGWIFYFIPW